MQYFLQPSSFVTTAPGFISDALAETVTTVKTGRASVIGLLKVKKSQTS